MEHIQITKFFADTDKFDRFTRHGSCRKRRTTSGVTIELGKYKTINAQRLIK
ncbi:hypothetical protein SDC9_104362 [bioreactor metagenome]|uniref:Uncharacterized protein n=1 Tax=bioreactor metagenome TaxID=1076179 RepID=A0A645AWL2_9ZZZZ